MLSQAVSILLKFVQVNNSASFKGNSFAFLLTCSFITGTLTAPLLHSWQNFLTKNMSMGALSAIIFVLLISHFSPADSWLLFS